MADVIEVELDQGILSFDGRVIEAFGFRQTEARRVHLSHVELLELKLARGRAQIQVRGRGSTGFAVMPKVAEAQAADVGGWLEAIAAAAPSEVTVKR